MGRQPFGLASAAAWLRAAGWDGRRASTRRRRSCGASASAAADLDRVSPADAHGDAAGGPVIAAARRVNPRRASARSGCTRRSTPSGCARSASTRSSAASSRRSWRPGRRSRATCEHAQDERRVEERVTTGPPSSLAVSLSNHERQLPRIHFLVPDRTGLPPLARIRDAADARRRAPHWSATPKRAAAAGICAGTVRSCRSTTGSSASCSPTSCSPTSPRRSRPARGTSPSAIPTSSTVPTHAMRIVDALHAAHPPVSYDVTIKVEHLLQHRDLLPRLAATGCVFVTSAVESVDDRVLRAARQGAHARRLRRGRRALPRARA